MKIKPAKLTPTMLAAFAGGFLYERYDQPVPTPDFHYRGWELYCSDHPQCSLVAPREHAKSTSFTFTYILAEVCFRNSDYVILVSSTEEFAAEQLGNIRTELLENEALREEVGIVGFEKDSTTDIIVNCVDGHQFRILARGAEQRIRGRLWKGKRPNLLICDDMEDDEQVENKDRREKFRRWFFRAAKQALGRGGRTRAHGTILHEDSLLSRLQKNKTWRTLFHKAHDSFDDFSNILWVEAWPEERLRARRQEFIEDGDSAGYSQEFLNDPQDNSEAYLRKGDFVGMNEDERARHKIYGAAADFAVSKADRANRTSFTVGGKDQTNLLHIVDERVGRWASMEIVRELPPDLNQLAYTECPQGYQIGWIEEMFSLQTRWDLQFFWVEDGVIWKAIKDMVFSEMRKRDVWINIIEIPSIKDKATRGRAYQKRHRAGGLRFDKQAEWYPGFESENLKFTGNSAATLDDQFDSAALLALGFDRHMEVPHEEDFMEEEELETDRYNRDRGYGQGRSDGRNSVTGY